MNKAQALCMQQQAMAIKLLTKQGVVFTITVTGITDNRVEDMFQMAA